MKAGSNIKAEDFNKHLNSERYARVVSFYCPELHRVFVTASIRALDKPGHHCDIHHSADLLDIESYLCFGNSVDDTIIRIAENGKRGHCENCKLQH